MRTIRSGGVVACISLEAWDDTWRRNQHFASRLVKNGFANRLIFVEPPLLGRRPRRFSPLPGITVLRPPLLLPKRAGGLRLTGGLLRRTVLRRLEVLWVNDPVLGVYCLAPGTRAVYDVTDDWRAFAQPDYITERLVRAEDRLAIAARTVVCSAVLSNRWQERYQVSPSVVQNAVDLDAFETSTPSPPLGAGPHLGYVGTLHAQRLDVDLVLDVADATSGTVHLIGPDALDPPSRTRLASHPRIRLQGPVRSAEVPSVMCGMDVLICPHRIDPFTLSLDAIKAHEYLASGRPVVATATSGFQLLDCPGLTVAGGRDFVSAAVSGKTGPSIGRPGLVGWGARTDDFARQLGLRTTISPRSIA